MIDDYSFALCLTHDVDRPYKTYQSLYYAVQDRPLHHLTSALPGVNPYWQFESVMEIESAFDVRSAFYFLNEPPLTRRRPSEWVSSRSWIEHLCRYDVTSGEIASVVEELDEGGWEVGLHGSYHSYTDRSRLAQERRVLESVVGHPVAGVRQHYLRLDGLETWRHHDALGFTYDASLGSSTDFGFHHGYTPIRPFGSDSEFLVFPLTVMEATLPDPGVQFEAAVDACEELLTEAAENDAVMTALWHPRYFDPDEFPGYRRLYRRLLERAVEMGAWIGPPKDLCDRLGRSDGHDASMSVQGPREGAIGSDAVNSENSVGRGESNDRLERGQVDPENPAGARRGFDDHAGQNGEPCVKQSGVSRSVDGTGGNR